jgi:choline monooxygenase
MQTDTIHLPAIPAADLQVQPVERAETIPSRWYWDPAFDRLDRDAVFGRTWQGVGHAAQVREEGQFLSAEVAGNPVIVVRGKDGVLRGFYNVCKHRGGPLAVEPEGCVRALQCKYHGWTYLLDGSLRGVPQFDRVELFDRKDYGLVPVRVEEWEGQVFVNLWADAPPLAQFVEGIVGQIAPAKLGALQFVKRVEYDIACNWKVYVDNYLEGYHVPHVHPELVKLYDFQSYRTECFEWYSLQHSPLSGTANLYTSGDGAAFYYCVFPNYMLNILPGRLQTNLVQPLGPARCRVIFQYFYANAETPAVRRLVEEDLAYSDGIQREDIDICERVQRGVESRAYDRGRFSVKYEEGVYHFQRLLKGAYRSFLAESGSNGGPQP